MNDPVRVDIFAEDHAHEEFLTAIVRRLSGDENVPVSIRVRAARGGHARAIDEFMLYQSLVEKGIAGMTSPDLLIVGIDGNCTTFARKRDEIKEATGAAFSDRLIVACPDPHVERWYLADPDSFFGVVGGRPVVGRKKCARDHYKRLLAEAVRDAGHPTTLGGIEFAAELINGMDLYRAGRNDHSLRAFLDDLRKGLRQADLV
jgi:hypothetical protein